MSEKLRSGSFIGTYTGINFFPLDPVPEEININDIAHALSNICRYQGHCPEFYSVAQHSVLVSDFVSPKYALWGLLHDASEAYICDLSRPLKREKMFRDYKRIEKNLMTTICERFNLSPVEPLDIQVADRCLLVNEARQFGLINENWFCYNDQVPFIEIKPLPPKEAEKLFLHKFEELGRIW